MIRYLAHAFIDRSKYDHCVRMDPSGLPYAYSWYLDAVCEAWDALILNDYEAVWPLPKRNRMGIRYFYRPYAVQQLGVYHKVPLSGETLAQFVLEMQRHCRFADLYLNEGQIPDVSSIRGVELKQNQNLTLDISGSYREIYHGYNQNTRRNIRKAAGNDLQVFEHDSPRALMRLFKEAKANHLELPESFYRNMEVVMFKCLHNGMGKLWTVYGKPNSLLGGAFIVESAGRHIFLFSALSEAGKDQKAMFHLINEYLIYHSGKGRVFDFEGSNSNSLARFYKGFGADSKIYWRLHYNGLPWPLRKMKKL